MAAIPLVAAPPVERLRPLRRVEYDELIRLGVFDEDERIELLEGFMVPMSPIGPPHCATIDTLTELFVRALAGRARVRIQNAFAALELSEPQPDVAIVPVGDYYRAHPESAQLLIEVADSSLRIDRGVKQRIYASCGVPEYWIVNLVDDVIEVFTEPSGTAYASVRRYTRGEVIRPVQFSDLEIAVDVILPR